MNETEAMVQRHEDIKDLQTDIWAASQHLANTAVADLSAHSTESIMDRIVWAEKRLNDAKIKLTNMSLQNRE